LVNKKKVNKEELYQAFKKVMIATEEYYWLYKDKRLQLVYNWDSKVPLKVSKSLIVKLMNNEVTIGLSPFVNQSEVLFGGIDFDVHKPTPSTQKLKQEELGDKYAEWENEFIKESRDMVNKDIPAVCKILDEEGYLYFINSSGSEGRHIRVYSSKPIEGKVMRYFLKDVLIRATGKESHEVFPKQDNLSDDKPFGNQMKAPLSIHPKTGLMAGIVENGEVLNTEQSLKYIYEFATKIDTAKTILFNPPEEEIRKKEAVKKYYKDMTKFDKDKSCPNYCIGIEEVACCDVLPSTGSFNKHTYLDGNVYQYLKDQPQKLKSYMEFQGRNHTAFNNSNDWVFSCKTIWKYLQNNESKSVEKWKGYCKKCPLLAQGFENKFGSLIESIDDKDKTEKAIKDIFLNNLEVSPLQEDNIINEIVDITKINKSILKEEFKFVKDNIKKETEINKYKQIESKNDSVRFMFLNLRELKHYNEAIELLVEDIKKNNYIYTTKNDAKNEMWFYKKGIYVPNGRSEIKEILRNILFDNYNQHYYTQVINRIEADTFIESELFFNNNNPFEIPILNGILDLKTKNISQFNPRKIFFNKLNVEYNPEMDCPKIDKFLSEVLTDDDDRKIFYELGGFCLLKEYKFEKAFMFLGDGRNGKDKTLELLKRMIGIENCCSVPLSSMFADSFIISEFFGKMVNLSGEINNKDLKDTSMFKALTGRSLVSAQRKFLNPISFVNYAKFVFACNELPMIYDNSRGFWDRWILLEFPYTFVTEEEYIEKKDINSNLKIKDDDIINKITTPEEMSGLLNKFLTGLDRLNKNKKFSNTKGTDEIKNLWIGKSNSVMAFCLNNVEEHYIDFITKQQFRERYEQYCIKNKLKVENNKRIKKTIEELYGHREGTKSIDFKQEYIWAGLKFKGESIC